VTILRFQRVLPRRHREVEIGARATRGLRLSVAFWLVVLAMSAALGCSSAQPVTSTTTEYVATLLPVPLGSDYDSSDYLWGYVDTAGNWVIEPRFEEALYFHEGLAPVQFDGKWGYIDETGSMIIEPQFTEAYWFLDGIARVATGPPDPDRRWLTASGYGFIDKTGRMVIPATWDDADGFYDGLAAVMLDSACGFINRNGELAIPLKFDAVGPFSEGLAQAQLDGKFGYIDTKGRWKIDPQFANGVTGRGVLLNGDLAGVGAPFTSGLAPVYVEGTSFGGGGICQYIDKKGNKAFPQVFQHGGAFNEGLAPVCVNDKWGFIDASGTVVIEPQFDVPYRLDGSVFYLMPSMGFHNGLAPVALHHKVGYIDHDGVFVVAPQFGLGFGFVGGFARVWSESVWSEGMYVPDSVIDTTGRFVYRLVPTLD
jgi:hypothetical protein